MTTNPALDAVRFLAGDWDMELSGASFLPDPDATVAGSATFEWIAGGAALAMRMGAGTGNDATWIIGRDDCEPDYNVLYCDTRGVSRVYRMTLAGGTWRMWRDTPQFSQRWDAVISAGQAEITGTWRKSTDAGATWHHDFNLRYTRRP
jgi:hypothetical protein